MKIKVRYPLGLLSFLLLFSCSVSVHVWGYEVDSILMYDDIDPTTSAPVGLGEIYFTHSGYAYCWVNFSETTGSLLVRFDWFDTVRELYVSHQTTTEDLGSGLARAYDYIEIDGNPPASDLGEWTVMVYADDELIGTESFSIIDYNAIVENTDALVDQFAEVVSSFNQFKSDFESMREDLEERSSDLNELRDIYGALKITYEDQISNYNDILSEKITFQEDYNSLAADYEELVLNTNQLADDYDGVIDDVESMAKRLSNSRNLTYASVALAVVFLGAAIYVYTKK